MTLARTSAEAIDGAARRVRLADGTALDYDRLILSPGIALRFDALPGYDAARRRGDAACLKAGAQTELLARQLAALPEGGTVVLSVRATPIAARPAPTSGRA